MQKVGRAFVGRLSDCGIEASPKFGMPAPTMARLINWSAHSGLRRDALFKDLALDSKDLPLDSGIRPNSKLSGMAYRTWLPG